MNQLLIEECKHRTTARRSSRGWQELIVDNFAGGGGASLGIELATGRAVDISINHDPSAVAMHAINHPATRHLTEDVYQVDPREVTRGRPVGLAWFSPDCRHFSRAKGGKPVEGKIRGLAWVVLRWAGMVRPRVIVLENVREFQTWGPLNRRSRPIKAKMGRTFARWKSQLEALGYVIEHRILDAADYGAPTHRKRLFIVARRDGQAIKWPTITHGKSPLKKYRTAAECIDWTIPCRSIFGRKTSLKENTLRRIALGLKRYVLEAANPFIVTVNHGGHDFRCRDINDPLNTVTGSHGTAVVTPYMVEVQNASNVGHRQVDRPAHTITGNPKGGGMAVVAPILSKYHGQKSPGDSRCTLGTDPLNTVDTSNRHALVAALLTKHYGGVVGHGVDRPIGTVTAVDHHSVTAAYITRMNFGDKQWNGVDEPLSTITAQSNKLRLVYAFLMKYYGTGGQWSELAEPMHTITAKRRMGLVMVEVVPGEVMPAVGLWIDGLGAHVIADIGMRMLEPHELLAAQFSPELAKDYILTGSKANRVHKIGNSVCPLVAKAIVEANYRDEEMAVVA